MSKAASSGEASRVKTTGPNLGDSQNVTSGSECSESDPLIKLDILASKVSVQTNIGNCRNRVLHEEVLMFKTLWGVHTLVYMLKGWVDRALLLIYSFHRAFCRFIQL